MTKSIVQLVSMATIGVVLLALGHPVLGAIPLVLAALIALLALVAPAVVATLETLVARVGRAVGSALGAATLTVVYFTVFTVTAWWLRLRGSDPLDRRFPASGRSNWIERAATRPEIYAKQYTPPHGRPT